MSISKCLTYCNHVKTILILAKFYFFTMYQNMSAPQQISNSHGQLLCPPIAAFQIITKASFQKC